LNRNTARTAAPKRLGESWRRTTHEIGSVQIVSTRDARPRSKLAQVGRRNVIALLREGTGSEVQRFPGEAGLVLIF
jgi:hypothetical protein